MSLSCDPDAIALLAKLIKNRKNWSRELATAYQRLHKEGPETTGRIFLDYGDAAAGAAYVLAKSSLRQSGHDVGKTISRRLLARFLARLEDSSQQDRQAAAIEVAKILEPETARIELMLERAGHSTKQSHRQRMRSTASSNEIGINESGANGDTGKVSDAPSPLPDAPGPHSPTLHESSGMLQLDILPHVQEDASQQAEILQQDTSQQGEDNLSHLRDVSHQGILGVDGISQNHSMSQQIVLQDDDLSRSGGTSQPGVLQDHNWDISQQGVLQDSQGHEHIHVDASVEACNRLFPEYLARAIKRDHTTDRMPVAAVSITFPVDHEKALLSIAVIPSKIEHIAWELFRIRLEAEGGLRYGCFGAAKVVPSPSFGLKGCLVKSIPLMFGTELTAALCADDTYRDERLKGDDRTECISMVVPAAAADSASICISFHPRQGTRLRDKLFGKDVFPCA